MTETTPEDRVDLTETPGRPKVLVVGDAVAPTGFARVLQCVLERLRGRYEFHQMGINYWGDPHDLAWKIYPAGLHGDGRGLNRLAGLVEKLRPDLIFIMADLWQLMQYAGILARLPNRIPAIAYFPVESDPVEPKAMVHLLQGIDHLVTYTGFGAKEVERAVLQARTTHPELPARPLSVIGHGVDQRVFFPLAGSRPEQLAEGRLAARTLLFDRRPDLRDAFIVLNANRNQPRKRIDVTIEAFALFSADKPDTVKLYLHMARQDVGWDIQRLAERFNVLDRLIVTRNDDEHNEVCNSRLNHIYNACDVGVNTSSSEGWGLVSFEHGATGAAQIVPRHTSLTGLWEDAAELVEPSYSVISEQILTRAYFTSPRDVAQAMQHLYEDPARRQRLSEAAIRLTSQPRMNWDNIAGQWDQVFSAHLRPTPAT